MTTTTSSIATVPVPLGVVRRAWPYGGKAVWTVKELDAKRKRKRSASPVAGGMYQLGEAKSKLVIDNKGKDDDRYKFKGKIGIWRTVMGRRYFFPDDNSGSIPKLPSNVRPGKGTAALKKKRDRESAIVGKVISGLESQLAAAKSDGLDGKSRRIKAQIKDIKARGIAAAREISSKKAQGGSGDGGGDWEDYAENKLLGPLQAAMKRARVVGNRDAFGVMRKMEAAIRKGDMRAYLRAASGLKGAIKRTERKVNKQNRKESGGSVFMPKVIGKFFKEFK